MSNRIKTDNKGFTLIELMVALTIFIAVMTIAMGSIFSVFNANWKSKNLKTALSNLNLALESMSREIRFGTRYHCDSGSGRLTSPRSCAGGGDRFSFLSSEGVQTTYRRRNSALEKNTGSGFIPVTAPEIIIQSLTFYTLGASRTDTLQPKTVIIVRGTVGTGSAKGVTAFTMQTLASQRVTDR